MFEHILHYMMVPGKAENWVVVIDLIDLGLATLPIAVSFNIMFRFLKKWLVLYKQTTIQD